MSRLQAPPECNLDEEVADRCFRDRDCRASRNVSGGLSTMGYPFDEARGAVDHVAGTFRQVPWEDKPW